MNTTIDQRLPGRVGCPILPVLPLSTTEYEGTERQNLEQVTPEVEAILEKHSVVLHWVLLKWRKSRGAADAERQLTLVLTSEYTPTQQQQWVDAVMEVRSLLHASKLDWSVELTDIHMYIGQRKSFPILSTDNNLIDSWGNARSDFFNKIQNHDWVAVDVLHRGYLKDETYPTIIISTRDANNSALWDTTLQTLRQVLQHHGVNAQVELLFTKGLDFATTEEGLNPTTTEEGPNSTTTEDSPKEVPSEPHTTVRETFYQNMSMGISMGTSCAASGSNHSGTLGGWIRLKKGLTVLELGLTNYHVLKEGIQDIVKAGFGGDSRYGTVVSPSDNDHQIARAFLEKNVRDMKNDLDDCEMRLECVSRDDPSYTSSFNGMDMLRMNLSSALTKLRAAISTSRKIGKIYLASEFKTRDNWRYSNQPGKPDQNEDWAIDWCLFRMEWPPSISRTLERHGLTSTNFDYINGQDRRQAVTQYCSFSARKNYKVAKRGRTSGWTNGTLSAIPSTMRYSKLTPEEYEAISNHERIPTNQYIDFQDKFGGKPVSVHTIISTTEERFISPGDSGAFVLLNETPNVVSGINGLVILGMGFAANDANLTSYMMPFDLLVEDIEEATHGKIIEPHFAGTLD